MTDEGQSVRLADPYPYDQSSLFVLSHRLVSSPPQNQGLMKLLTGDISWYYSNPKDRVRGWRRLVAQHGTDPDVLLVTLIAAPFKSFWLFCKMVFTRKGACAASMRFPQCATVAPRAPCGCAARGAGSFVHGHGDMWFVHWTLDHSCRVALPSAQI